MTGDREPKRILVIVLRRLGDVLLTTPLVRSLRRAWPNAEIDALVFDDTAAILQGNPDLSRVIPIPAKPGFWQTIALVLSLLRRYSLAISTQAGDRPTLLAFVAGRERVGVLEVDKGRWKRWLLDRAVAQHAHVHRVEQNLRLADALKITRAPEMVAPQPASVPAVNGPYAVLHPAPMYRYKRWTVEGWRALALALQQRGLSAVVTGGPSASERAYLDTIWPDGGVVRLDGSLSWPQISGLIAGARVFVGPDTSTTHLAAATGCKTVALFGPTDPRLWAPWPQSGFAESWPDAGAITQRGNVWMVQHAYPCLPCQLEGCERHIGSDSACLTQLPANDVIDAVDRALASSSAG